MTSDRQKDRGERPVPLTGAQRRRLRGLGHSLQAIVHVGKEGVTESVRNAVDEALDDHELIKVRFLGGRQERDELGAELAVSQRCELVGAIGHVALLYRRQRDPDRRKIKL